MFEGAKKLLVVYKDKDEIALNQLRKLIDTNDDVDGEYIVGTEDGTVKVVAWNEKTWLDNKKAGNTGDLDDKILFLGDIKGVDKLIPTLDKKFDKHGVSYGFSGKQIAISIDGSKLIKKANYDEFIEDLKKVCNAETVNEKRKFDLNDKTKNGVKLVAVQVLFGLIGSGITLATYAFGDAKTIRIQQLLYGVTNLYLNDLDAFMKE